MTFLEIVLICFTFWINFVQMANGQNCNTKNRIGSCAILSCPPHRNGTICVKQRCVTNDEPATPNIATISSIVVGVFVLFAIIVVVAVMRIRSRRPNRDSTDRKRSVRSAVNPYTFRGFPPSTMTGLNNLIETPHPPLPPYDDQDENPYEYETVDFPKPKSQTTNTTTEEETENGYLIPTALAKPNLPPPRICDSTY